MTRSNRRYIIIYRPKYHLTKREKRQNKGKGSDGQPWHDELQSLRPQFPILQAKEKKKINKSEKDPSLLSRLQRRNKQRWTPIKLRPSRRNCNATQRNAMRHT
ncbi:hypothetical protein J3E68DRAFT_399041 [Trichoderma sp. SZMC 28012]